MQSGVIAQDMQAGRTSPDSRARILGLAPLWIGRIQSVLTLLGILVLAFGLRTVFLGIRPEFVAGTFSLDAVRKTLSDGAAFVESHHLADYRAVVVEAIQWVAAAAAPTRELSFLTGMTAVLLTWWVGRRLFSAPIGILAAALLAISPLQVIASGEVGIDLPLECLVLASTLILWRALEWPSSLWYWGGYGAVVALMARTSPYALLLLPAHAIWVLAQLRFGDAIEHLSLAGAVGAALYFAGNSRGLAFPDPTVLLSHPVHIDAILRAAATQAFGGNLFRNGGRGAGGIQLTYLLLLAFLSSMAAGAMALGRINRWTLLLVGLSWMIPVVLVALASPILGREPYTRPILFTQPFAALFVAAGILWLRGGFRPALKADRVPA